jgi:hypothetical protein
LKEIKTKEHILKKADSFEKQNETGRRMSSWILRRIVYHRPDDEGSNDP